MKKIISILSIIALIALISNLALASAPAPAPMCYVEGIIQSVEFNEAYDEPCLTEVGGCPTDMELNHPARYILSVEVDYVSYLSGDTNFRTCEDIFPLGSDKVIFVNDDMKKENDTFKPDQKIKGDVSTYARSMFDIYDVEDPILDGALDPTIKDKEEEKYTDGNTEERDQGTRTFLYAIVLVSVIVLALSVYLLKKRRE